MDAVHPRPASSTPSIEDGRDEWRCHEMPTGGDQACDEPNRDQNNAQDHERQSEELVKVEAGSHSSGVNGRSGPMGKAAWEQMLGLALAASCPENAYASSTAQTRERPAPPITAPPSNERRENQLWRGVLNEGLRRVLRSLERSLGKKKYPFLVDVFHIPDYHSHIHEEDEMWLQHIEFKAKSRAYSCVAEFWTDINQILAICKAYNMPGCGIFGSTSLIDMAEDLVKHADEAMAAHSEDLETAEQMLKDPECAAPQKEEGLVGKRIKSSVEGCGPALPPGCMHSRRITPGKPEGYTQYWVECASLACPFRGFAKADRASKLTSFFKVHKDCREEWSDFEQREGESSADHERRIKLSFTFWRIPPPDSLHFLDLTYGPFVLRPEFITAALAKAKEKAPDGQMQEPLVVTNEVVMGVSSGRQEQRDLSSEPDCKADAHEMGSRSGNLSPHPPPVNPIRWPSCQNSMHPPGCDGSAGEDLFALEHLQSHGSEDGQEQRLSAKRDPRPRSSASEQARQSTNTAEQGLGAITSGSPTEGSSEPQTLAEQFQEVPRDCTEGGGIPARGTEPTSVPQPGVVAADGAKATSECPRPRSKSRHQSEAPHGQTLTPLELIAACGSAGHQTPQPKETDKPAQESRLPDVRASDAGPERLASLETTDAAAVEPSASGPNKDPIDGIMPQDIPLAASVQANDTGLKEPATATHSDAVRRGEMPDTGREENLELGTVQSPATGIDLPRRSTSPPQAEPEAKRQICINCHQEKVLEDFHRYKEGRKTCCKACRNEEQRRRRLAKVHDEGREGGSYKSATVGEGLPEKSLSIPKANNGPKWQTCVVCHQEKVLEDFGRHKEGRKTQCKACRNEDERRRRIAKRRSVARVVWRQKVVPASGARTRAIQGKMQKRCPTAKARTQSCIACGQHKELSCFYRKPDGEYQAKCKICQQKRRRELAFAKKAAQQAELAQEDAGGDKFEGGPHPWDPESEQEDILDRILKPSQKRHRSQRPKDTAESADERPGAQQKRQKGMADSKSSPQAVQTQTLGSMACVIDLAQDSAGSGKLRQQGAIVTSKVVDCPALSAKGVASMISSGQGALVSKEPSLLRQPPPNPPPPAVEQQYAGCDTQAVQAGARALVSVESPLVPVIAHAQERGELASELAARFEALEQELAEAREEAAIERSRFELEVRQTELMKRKYEKEISRLRAALNAATSV